MFFAGLVPGKEMDSSNSYAAEISAVQSDRLDRAIAHLEAAVSHGDNDELIRRLNEAVPTYTPMSSRSIEHIH